jgi:hypothetical protein
VGSTKVKVDPYQTKMPHIPWFVIPGIITGASILLVFVLVKEKYIYTDNNDNVKKIKKEIIKEQKKKTKRSLRLLSQLKSHTARFGFWIVLFSMYLGFIVLFPG